LVRYFPGWIPSSFPCPNLELYKFVHIDVDLYHPTKDSLEYFWPRMALGGIIVTDDYNWPGAKKAFEDFAKSKCLILNTSGFGQAYFVKNEK